MCLQLTALTPWTKAVFLGEVVGEELVADGKEMGQVHRQYTAALDEVKVGTSVSAQDGCIAIFSNGFAH